MKTLLFENNIKTWVRDQDALLFGSQNTNISYIPGLDLERASDDADPRNIPPGGLTTANPYQKGCCDSLPMFYSMRAAFHNLTLILQPHIEHDRILQFDLI